MFAKFPRVSAPACLEKCVFSVFYKTVIRKKWGKRRNSYLQKLMKTFEINVNY